MLPPGEQSQNCRCECLNWGFGKAWGTERAVVLVWSGTDSLPQAKISRLHTGSNPSVFMPMLGSSSPGLEIQPPSELSRKLHELVYG